MERTDLVVPGLIPIVFKHVYRSGDNGWAWMGIGSTHSYDYRVWPPNKSTPPQEMWFIQPNNSRYRFVRQPDGSYINTNTHWLAGARLYDSGVVGSQARYLLQFKDGTRFYFSSRIGYLGFIVDANWNRLELLYDPSDDRLLREIRQPGGRFLKLHYGSNYRISRVTDNAGRSVGYVYDADGRLIAVTNAMGGVTSFTYTNNNLRTVTRPDGVVEVQVEYDANGRVSREIFADGSSKLFTYATHAVSGLVTQSVVQNAVGALTRYNFSTSEHWTGTVDAQANTTSYVRDPVDGALLRTIDPLSRTTSFVYDANCNVTAITNALGKVTRMTYEPVFNRLTSVIDPLGRTNSFGYDALGNLTNVTDALGRTVSYAYDSMNRLTTRTDQLGRQEIYRYDKNGNVTNFVDRRGVSITFKYDTLDRRTGVVYAANDSVRYFYDRVGRVTNINDSIAGNIRLTYDSLDRLTQEFNNNGTVTYAYNDVGLRTNMTVTGETPVFYRYDAANRLTNVTQGTFTTSLFYDDAGRRTRLVLPNGIQVLYSYDTARVTGGGVVFREYTTSGNPTGRYVQWHPGGGHHGPQAYWKVSSGTTGTVRVGPQF